MQIVETQHCLTLIPRRIRFSMAIESQICLAIEADQILWFSWQCRRRRRDYANVAAVEENKSCAIAREKSFHRRDFHKKFGLKYIATIGALRIY